MFEPDSLPINKKVTLLCQVIRCYFSIYWSNTIVYNYYIIQNLKKKKIDQLKLNKANIGSVNRIGRSRGEKIGDWIGRENPGSVKLYTEHIPLHILFLTSLISGPRSGSLLVYGFPCIRPCKKSSCCGSFSRVMKNSPTSFSSWYKKKFDKFDMNNVWSNQIWFLKLFVVALHTILKEFQNQNDVMGWNYFGTNYCIASISTHSILSFKKFDKLHLYSCIK